MTTFHVLHCMPEPRMHIFNGYREVIETVVWGLRSLGHEVSRSVNQTRTGAVHIVFGAQLMEQVILDLLPDDTIIYNLEQLHGLMSSGRQMQEFYSMAGRFAIWDYSIENVQCWQQMFAARRACHVPIGFAPILCRIAKPVEQDIDVLIYGAPSENRLQALRELCHFGLSTMFVCGLYDEARDALIGRAKLVVNIASSAQSNIFSIVRVSYLLANRKAVIADIAAAESDMVQAVKFSALDQVPLWCSRYIAQPDLRTELEEQGFRTMQRRDVRGFLAAALAA